MHRAGVCAPRGDGGGRWWHTAPYLSHAAAKVVRLNTAIKASALQFESRPKDLSHVVVWSSKGLRLVDAWAFAVTPWWRHWPSSRFIARLWSRVNCGPTWATCMRSMGCADSLWFRRRHSRRTRETRGLTVCSGQWVHWGSVFSCRPRCSRAHMLTCHKCTGLDGGG